MPRKIGRAKARLARITAKQRVARKKNIAIARSHKKRSTAGKAFKGAYKQSYARLYGKEYARRVGHTAAIKKDMIGGKKMARKYAMGVARKKFGMGKKGARQFSTGYINSILSDLKRGA